MTARPPHDDHTMSHHEDQPLPSDEFTLSRDDDAALEALISHDWDAARIADPALRARAEAVAQRMTAPLDALRSAEESSAAFRPDPALISATLLRIEAEDSLRSERYSIAAAQGASTTGGRGRGIRIPDFITVAALLMVGVAILFPMASQARHGAELASCAASLGDLFHGFDCYADDHNGYAPTADGFRGKFDRLNANGLDASTDDIEESASGCLHSLESGGYCHGKCTKCCGTKPISVRIPMHRRHLILAYQKDTPLAGDANPFICQLRQCDRMQQQACAEGGGGGSTAPGKMACAQRCAPMELPIERLDLNSPNHGGRGQNILGGDGSIRWTVTPVLLGQGPAPSDNIWLPRGLDGIERFQFSGLREDAFEIVLAH